MHEPLLEIRDLAVHFPIRRGGFLSKQVGTVKAVDGVSLSIEKGKTLSLVGESGCGKSTTVLALLGMAPLTRGSVRFKGEPIDLTNSRSLFQFRRQAQMIFQDPFGSLNPRMRVCDIIAEPLRIHMPQMRKEQREERVRDLMGYVGLLPTMAERYPHEFSGGQRQRIGVARALSLNPELVICDESVSALDVSIQAQVLNLLMDLQDELGLTYIFVSHDLAVVRHISHRIAVMYLGQIMELADKEGLYRMPKHPYTQALLSAIPIADPVAEAQRQRIKLGSEIQSVINVPSGSASIRDALMPGRSARVPCRQRKKTTTAIRWPVTSTVTPTGKESHCSCSVQAATGVAVAELA